MRTQLLLASTAMSLAACGGGGTGVQTVGNIAPAATAPTTQASFVNPTESKTYAGLGGVQHYEYETHSDGSGQGQQLYAGDANTVRDSGIAVTYDPRSAIFDLTITRSLGSVSTGNMRYQDPQHRTAFGGLAQPQAGVSELPASRNIQYLQSGSYTGELLSRSDPRYPARSDYAVGDDGYSSTTQTFFYQKPGTTTQYVTYAGFVRNSLSVTLQTHAATGTSYLNNSYSIDRGVFVYGEQSNNNAVPRTGSGTYTGEMLATMVYNPRGDTDPGSSTYFQWIQGTQTTSVNFATLAVSTSLTGTVLAPARDAYTNGLFDMPAGATFTASASALIDLANRGGFTGSFSSAGFTRPNGTTAAVNIAGSSLDGAFYGPNGEEIGAGFRIVGGTPDQRIDILGVFTGRR